MMKLFISILIGSLLLYISFKGVDVSTLLSRIHKLNYSYLILAFSFFLMVPLLRAVRLRWILEPVKRLRLKSVYIYNAVGYLFIVLLPLRLGELSIPIILKKNANIPIGAAIPSIFIERIIDLFVLLSLLFFSIYHQPMPEWVRYSMFGLAGMAVVAAAVFLFFYFKFDFTIKIIKKIIHNLPTGLEARLLSLFANLRSGMQIIGRPFQLLRLFLFSYVIWLVSASALYFFFAGLFDSIPLHPMNALSTTVFNVIGISLPAGPGMIGNFQYSLITGLGLAGIEKEPSFLFANLYYLFTIGITVLNGIIFLHGVNFHLKDLKSSFTDNLPNSEKTTIT
jgi:glycosyltransferase 2 family protein